MNLILSLIVFVISVSSYGQSDLKSFPNNGRVEFEAIGSQKMMRIAGSGEGVAAALKVSGTKITGDAVFRLESLKTGLDERDEQMREKYLEVKTFPTAKITFSEFQMPPGWSIENARIVNSSFRGKLLLHGVEREITGLFSIEPKQLKVTADFDVKFSDFNITAPEYLGIKVADFVKIKVVIESLLVAKK